MLDTYGHGGYKFYARLKMLGYPKDIPLQVMCYNCNIGRQWNGGVCPHHLPVNPGRGRKAFPFESISIEDEPNEPEAYLFDDFNDLGDQSFA